MEIALPEPGRLVGAEQYRLLCQLTDPDETQLASRAHLAAALDKHIEAREDLEAIDPARRSVDVSLALARVCRELGDHEAGLAAIERVEPSLLSQDQSLALRIERATMLRKLGRNDEARILLESVLHEDPANLVAQRKLGALLFARGDHEAALALAQRLIAAGAPSPRVLGTAAIALAALGRRDEAEAIRGFDRFYRQEILEDHDDLDARVIAELRAHPALRFGNSREASEGSWRVDELMVRRQPALVELLQRIVARAETYVEQLGGTPHPWLDAQPLTARMKAWAILAPADGVESWHTHDGGWLSGVYYLAVPEDLARGEDKAGAIEFGWADRFLGDEVREQLSSRIVHPEPGMLLMFPSHIHHRTWPHRRKADRICIAFDIQPAR